MKQDASVELCTTLDITWNYLMKALQGSQFCCCHNIILGFHEDDIHSYNESGRALIEEKKIKLEKEKEEAQKADKLAGNFFNQGVCLVKVN